MTFFSKIRLKKCFFRCPKSLDIKNTQVLIYGFRTPVISKFHQISRLACCYAGLIKKKKKKENGYFQPNLLVGGFIFALKTEGGSLSYDVIKFLLPSYAAILFMVFRALRDSGIQGISQMPAAPQRKISILAFSSNFYDKNHRKIGCFLAKFRGNSNFEPLFDQNLLIFDLEQ